jgi:hypothetical protein
LEGTGGEGLNRGEGRDSGVSVRFALLAKGTSFDVLTNKVRKTWPPILSGDELAGFKITWMAGREMVMRTSDDVAAKRTRVRDIDSILVGKETPIDLPIREARAEGRGYSAIEGLKSIANEDIVTGGGGNEVMEGGIDAANEERWGKEGYILIIRGDGEFIQSARKGIRTSECRSQDISDLKVKVSEVKKPASLTTIQMLGTMKEGEVLVICKDLDWERESAKVLAPGFKGTDDCE